MAVTNIQVLQQGGGQVQIQCDFDGPGDTGFVYDALFTPVPLVNPMGLNHVAGATYRSASFSPGGTPFFFSIQSSAGSIFDQMGTVDPPVPGVFSNFKVNQLGNGQVELQYDNDAAAPVTTEAEFGLTPAFGTTVPTTLVSGTTYKTAPITPAPPGQGFYWKGIVT